MFLPYVYIVRNRNTGRFYIGMRSVNKVVAEQDLGVHYFTSSKHVKNNFSEYDSEILAYFVDQISAFEFENDLIKEHWGDPLLLNRHYQKSMSRFSMAGAKREDLAEYNRKTKSKPKEIRHYKCTHCNTVIIKEEFCHHAAKSNYYCNASCRGLHVASWLPSRAGIPKPYKEGRTAWNKGKSGTGFGNLNTNPMKNPIFVTKMIETRTKNKSKTGFAVTDNPMKDLVKIQKMLESRRINKEKKRGI